MRVSHSDCKAGIFGVPLIRYRLYLLTFGRRARDVDPFWVSSAILHFGGHTGVNGQGYHHNTTAITASFNSGWVKN